MISGILTSSVEDGLQRRFSVSASMDEISKVGLTSSPSGLGPEQAALAQSQHFDQLEALWNKQSPPARPRAHGRTLSKQSSLQATRISDSEEEGKFNKYIAVDVKVFFFSWFFLIFSEILFKRYHSLQNNSLHVSSGSEY